MKSFLATAKRQRHFLISLFVIVWTLVFHYESLRHFYLNPFFERPLPKLKLLFPPAGWIMFFNVNNAYGAAEVYGFKAGQRHLIDPHDILRTRAIGYDNIRRNVLSEVLDPSHQSQFCRFLGRRFPAYENFAIVATFYPSLTQKPQTKLYKVMYTCSVP